ncbi:hypothetical protein L6164_013841 [Bauhinia variegata]|uniref:Uncharacterized protein n=1 Tax=Bauhinia variegata TaxID=167791 RepID=A0ACB9NGQ1_BAUVA|nr:hypothetical protein L6164_013841 [Bauhinia variegata]
MQMHLTIVSALFLLFLYPALFSCAAAARNQPQDLIRSSCSHARYPSLCLQTLSNYGGPANTPKDLAQAAVRVSLAQARRVSDYIRSQAASSQSKSVSKRQRVALSDCVEQLSDSVDDLSKTLNELQHLRVETFDWQMSNAQTWVSAALTNDDTCLDGFNGVDGKLKMDVKGRITNVAMVTSNALYMINRLDDSRGKPRSKP